MPLPTRPRSNRPFLAAPRAAFYHPARMIEAARQNLERAIRRSEGIGMVIGPPGTGKSLLLAVIADQLRDDFEVAFLTGARICTRRALWQSILSELGEPYRGIDEADLRIGVLERIRGLSATGSGLVLLVDEAHTLPVRLMEELRLLSNVPTPLPAVHVVLAGTTDLEERLASPRMESLSQRIAVRAYLEPLDHGETVAYVRSQCATASLDWASRFDAGCDDAVFTITDGVPRLINQLCDHALLRAEEQGRPRVSRGDIEEAWRQIQQLPMPSAGSGGSERSCVESLSSDGVIEFGSLDDDLVVRHDTGFGMMGEESAADASAGDIVAFERPEAAASDPWRGPEVELVFDPASDPFEEYFEHEERVVERLLVRGPEDFRDRRHVASREGADLASRLDAWERTADDAARRPTAGDERRQPGAGQGTIRAALGRTGAGAAGIDLLDDAMDRMDAMDAAADTVATAADDSDMVVIEDDEFESPEELKRSIFAVRPGDYRQLFARLRRGDRGEPGR